MHLMIVPIAAAMAVNNVAQPVAPTLRHAQVAATPPSSAKALDPKSVAAAADVVRRFGALLEARRFKAARTLWSGAGAQTGLSEARFVAAYGRYAVIHAKVGPPGQSEGGAGSIYVDVPLRLSGKLRNGRPFALAGPVSLRRVNDVNGATPAQLRWHIIQVRLTPR